MFTRAQIAKRHYDRRIRPARAAARRAKAEAWCQVIDPFDICWAAGHFEGEGTVTISKTGRNNGFKPRVCLSSTDKETIDFFYERWPSKAISGPRQPNARAKPIWIWQLSGAIRVQKFLEAINPHLRTARVKEKVVIVLEFCEHLLATEYNREGDKLWKRPLYEAVKRLNRRGVPHMLTSDGQPMIERMKQLFLAAPEVADDRE